MNGPFLKLKEWGVAILTSIVIFAVIAAPAAVIRDAQRRTNSELELIQQVLDDHDSALEEQSRRTSRAVRALTAGISCILLIEPENRTSRKVNGCITRALRKQGFVNGN